MQLSKFFRTALLLSVLNVFAALTPDLLADLNSDTPQQRLRPVNPPRPRPGHAEARELKVFTRQIARAFENMNIHEHQRDPVSDLLDFEQDFSD